MFEIESQLKLEAKLRDVVRELETAHLELEKVTTSRHIKQEMHQE